MSGLLGRPLRALALSDGVAGHDRITLGVLTAITRRRPVEARRLALRALGGGSRRWERLQARLMPFDRFWPGRFDALDEREGTVAQLASERFDVVVATGPSISAAAIALARATGARSIYFGFPKLPFVAEFDVLLRPDPARVRFSQGVVVLRPSEIDPDGLPPARKGAERRKAALLLGGATKHHTLSEADFAQLEALVRGLVDEGLEVVVSNSRRTPASGFDRFVAALKPAGDAVRIIDFRSAGLMSNLDAFAADAVIVTADSMSMVAEAIAARRPTVVARPDGYRVPGRDAAELAVHVRRGLAFDASLLDLARMGWTHRLDRLSILTEHPLDRLADVIERAFHTRPS
ncbi:ELM1/GtrOC1 family putative glycosyltransferase [Methylopila sp. 73B]|uniref:ELM1/GtrOC1 family putative glycosyltransferase n=1 Tax=Methylopila sp. 73B TaxID=1120792 RepID=UPI000379F8AD|nr:ELM1/GtrOC1 family putative glycosyltransferase [Methylopila sp. 73B]